VPDLPQESAARRNEHLILHGGLDGWEIQSPTEEAFLPKDCSASVCRARVQPVDVSNIGQAITFVGERLESAELRAHPFTAR
jgi:hypothetical protein